MNNKFLKFLLTSASVLALSAVVSYAEEPAKKDGDKKDAPVTAPAAPEAPKAFVAEEAPAKKDGEKCPCPEEKPKASIDLNSDDCPKKCDKDKKDAPVAPAAPATAEEAPAKKDGDKKCPSCPDAPAPKA